MSTKQVYAKKGETEDEALERVKTPEGIVEEFAEKQPNDQDLSKEGYQPIADTVQTQNDKSNPDGEENVSVTGIIKEAKNLASTEENVTLKYTKLDLPTDPGKPIQELSTGDPFKCPVVQKVLSGIKAHQTTIHSSTYFSLDYPYRIPTSEFAHPARFSAAYLKMIFEILKDYAGILWDVKWIEEQQFSDVRVVDPSENGFNVYELYNKLTNEEKKVVVKTLRGVPSGSKDMKTKELSAFITKDEASLAQSLSSTYEKRLISPHLLVDSLQLLNNDKWQVPLLLESASYQAKYDKIFNNNFFVPYQDLLDNNRLLINPMGDILEGLLRKTLSFVDANVGEVKTTVTRSYGAVSTVSDVFANVPSTFAKANIRGLTFSLFKSYIMGRWMYIKPNLKLATFQPEDLIGCLNSKLMFRGAALSAKGKVDIKNYIFYHLLTRDAKCTALADMGITVDQIIDNPGNIDYTEVAFNTGKMNPLLPVKYFLTHWADGDGGVHYRSFPFGDKFYPNNNYREAYFGKVYTVDDKRFCKMLREYCKFMKFFSTRQLTYADNRTSRQIKSVFEAMANYGSSLHNYLVHFDTSMQKLSNTAMGRCQLRKNIVLQNPLEDVETGEVTNLSVEDGSEPYREPIEVTITDVGALPFQVNNKSLLEVDTIDEFIKSGLYVSDSIDEIAQLYSIADMFLQAPIYTHKRKVEFIMSSPMRMKTLPVDDIIMSAIRNDRDVRIVKYDLNQVLSQPDNNRPTSGDIWERVKIVRDFIEQSPLAFGFSRGFYYSMSSRKADLTFAGEFPIYDNKGRRVKTYSIQEMRSAIINRTIEADLNDALFNKIDLFFNFPIPIVIKKIDDAVTRSRDVIDKELKDGLIYPKLEPLELQFNEYDYIYDQRVQGMYYFPQMFLTKGTPYVSDNIDYITTIVTPLRFLLKKNRLFDIASFGKRVHLE